MYRLGGNRIGNGWRLDIYGLFFSHWAGHDEFRLIYLEGVYYRIASHERYEKTDGMVLY